MKDITIQVPDMQSSHCQMRVKTAIHQVEGVLIREIQPGAVTVAIENEAQAQNVIHAITEAGYKTLSDTEVPAEPEEGETFYFKTNINCGGCVSKVSETLNAAEGICHWEVNTQIKDKTLTVHSTGISREQVIDAVKNAGYHAELLNA